MSQIYNSLTKNGYRNNFIMECYISSSHKLKSQRAAGAAENCMFCGSRDSGSLWRGVPGTIAGVGGVGQRSQLERVTLPFFESHK